MRRLIPAHAGKTSSPSCSTLRQRAHPRSRGENIQTTVQTVAGWGSSPLTRGKHLAAWIAGVTPGLIPAHAGKTPPTWETCQPTRAHPRSRGENFLAFGGLFPPMGSSPLTRGKPSPAQARPARQGLIPAHAGKTSTRQPARPPGTAHPRSRGENLTHVSRPAPCLGSSPLTRGKPDGLQAAKPVERLIPAHAGKTLPDLRFYRADRSDLGKP